MAAFGMVVTLSCCLNSAGVSCPRPRAETRAGLHSLSGLGTQRPARFLSSCGCLASCHRVGELGVARSDAVARRLADAGLGACIGIWPILHTSASALLSATAVFLTDPPDALLEDWMFRRSYRQLWDPAISQAARPPLRVRRRGRRRPPLGRRSAKLVPTKSRDSCSFFGLEVQTVRIEELQQIDQRPLDDDEACLIVSVPIGESVLDVFFQVTKPPCEVGGL